MDKVQLTELLKSLEPEAEVKEGKQYAEAVVPAQKLYSFARALRENELTHLDYMMCLTGVDWGKEIGVVYHLHSTRHRHTVVLKVKTSDREKPAFDSVCEIWRTAEYHEREVYDLLGIRFNNHPDLRRFFLDSSWGYPLRKDYVDDINIVSK
jgi:NADH:ubiquinone oxidoreductase subunit C